MSKRANAPIVVRPVTSEDAAQLRDNCFSANTLAQVQALIADAVQACERGTQVLLVAVVDRLVVGTGTLTRNSHPLRAHRGELGGLVVHGNNQRRGVARRIVEAVLDRAASTGLEILVVGCRGGTPAEEVYPRLGFVECGRLPRGLMEAYGEQRIYDEVSFYVPLE